MSGENPKIRLTGEKSEIIIGDADENQGHGYLELGYSYGTSADDKPGIINLMPKTGTHGGNGFLWVDSSGRLRINGTQPTGSNYDSIGTIVGTQS